LGSPTGSPARPGQVHGGLDHLAACSGVAPRELLRLGLAWRAGGAAAVEVLGPPTAVESDAVAEGRAALASMNAAGRVRVQGNRVTAGGVQLRLGTDSRWYRFQRTGGAWELVGLPDP